ncbi:MAG: prepilin-type N-terminal cleavage/methylation domain-containing protein [Pseudomonadota bacterium]
MNRTSGFTLLEVLIAITLTGLVMGSLFAMQGQNKQLTFRSLAALDRLTEQREIINAAWIGLKLKKNYNYQIENIRSVDIPESLANKSTQIENLKIQLQSVDITDSSHQTLFTTVRLVKKD